ncbi:MAG: hypothetical protein ACE5I1_11355 [bacterium]
MFITKQNKQEKLLFYRELSTTLKALDERISKTKDHKEFIELIDVKKKEIEHIASFMDSIEKRESEKFKLKRIFGFAYISIPLGLLLVLLSYTKIGFFLLAAGVFVFVPEYVKVTLNWIKSRNGTSD